VSTPPSTVALGRLGPLVTAVDIDAWVLDALNTWLPTYLALYEDDRGIIRGTYPRPKTGHILTAITDAEFTDRQLPAIVVTALTNTGEPTRNPDWSYAAVARVNVSCIVRGRTPMETRATAAIYEACCRQLLSQKGVPGVARQRWTGWNIVPIPDTDSQGRYLAAGISTFNFEIDQMAQGGFAGPSVPVDDGMTQQYVPTLTIDEVTLVVAGLPPDGTFGQQVPWVGDVSPSSASASAGTTLQVTLTGLLEQNQNYQVGLPHGSGFQGYQWSDSANQQSDGVTLRALFTTPTGVTPGTGKIALYKLGVVTPLDATFTWTA
jgi:hypothetical protein